MSYKYSTSQGASLAAMTRLTATITNDPRSGGILYPQQTFALSGKQFAQGTPITTWFFGAMKLADFEALNTALGISPATASAAVAIYTLKTFATSHTFQQYNCVVHYAFLGENRKYEPKGYQDVVYRFVDLVEYTNP